MDKRELERFERRLNKTETCWIWTGSTSGKSGYGIMGVKRSGRWKAATTHRLSYEHWIGEIQPGLELDHLCRVRLCANPKHLEAVTRRENILRGVGPTAKNAQLTHCHQGHSFEGALINTKGERACRKCKNERDRRYRVENPERYKAYDRKKYLKQQAKKHP